MRSLDVLKTTPGVARVDRVRDLARHDMMHAAARRRWVHMIPSDSFVEYVTTALEGSCAAGAPNCGHGLPYDDDAHVAVILSGTKVKARRRGEHAVVAEMAPTVARVIGVLPTECVDGHALTQAFAVRHQQPC